MTEVLSPKMLQDSTSEADRVDSKAASPLLFSMDVLGQSPHAGTQEESCCCSLELQHAKLDFPHRQPDIAYATTYWTFRDFILAPSVDFII